MSKFAVILAAAGKSSRFGDPNTKKVFTTIETKPLWLFSAEKFSARDDVGQLLIVISPEDEEDFKQKFGANAAILGSSLRFTTRLVPALAKPILMRCSQKFGKQEQPYSAPAVPLL